MQHGGVHGDNICVFSMWLTRICRMHVNNMQQITVWPAMLLYLLRGWWH
jgi:hypothetical protein